MLKIFRLNHLSMFPQTLLCFLVMKNRGIKNASFGQNAFRRIFRPSEVVITSPKSKCLQVTDSMKKKRIFSFISSSKSKGKTNQKLISSKPIKAGLRHPKCRTPDAKVAISQLKMQVESLNEFVEVQNAINETQSAALAEITQKFLVNFSYLL